MAQPALGPAQPFDWDALKAQARELAPSRSSRPATSGRRSWPALTWDQYEALRFRPDHALWADTDLPFRVQFFHLGSYYQAAVRIFVVDDGQARPIEYDPSLFDYGPTKFDPPLPHDLGFAGWRLHFHTNFAAGRRRLPGRLLLPRHRRRQPVRHVLPRPRRSTPAWTGRRSSRASAASGWSGRARPTPR